MGAAYSELEWGKISRPAKGMNIGERPALLREKPSPLAAKRETRGIGKRETDEPQVVANASQELAALIVERRASSPVITRN